MVDIVDSVTRSRMMSGIRSRNTLPELALRTSLHELGFRFRLHSKVLPGKPDLVLPRYRAGIFVHGCFWHRHDNCQYASNPATRSEFWQEKFAANIARDNKNRKLLLEMGWRVAIVWECSLRRDVVTTSVTVSDWLKCYNEMFLEV